MPNDRYWMFDDDPSYNTNELIQIEMYRVAFMPAAAALAEMHSVRSRTLIAGDNIFNQAQLREWAQRQIVHLTKYVME